MMTVDDLLNDLQHLPRTAFVEVSLGARGTADYLRAEYMNGVVRLYVDPDDLDDDEDEL